MISTMEALKINTSKAKLTDDQFFEICRQNEGLRFEMTAQGDLIVMPPVGGLSGDREMSLGAKVWNWNDVSGLGRVFCFNCPMVRNGSNNVAGIPSQ